MRNSRLDPETKCSGVEYVGTIGKDHPIGRVCCGVKKLRSGRHERKEVPFIDVL